MYNPLFILSVLVTRLKQHPVFIPFRLYFSHKFDDVGGCPRSPIASINAEGFKEREYTFVELGGEGAGDVGYYFWTSFFTGFETVEGSDALFLGFSGETGFLLLVR